MRYQTRCTLLRLGKNFHPDRVKRHFVIFPQLLLRSKHLNPRQNHHKIKLFVVDLSIYASRWTLSDEKEEKSVVEDLFLVQSTEVLDLSVGSLEAPRPGLRISLSLLLNPSLNGSRGF